MKMLLHVGCGNKRKDRTTRGFNTNDWWEIRLDIDSSVKPDVIGTVSDMSGVATASVDAVFSSHNIEHLYPHEVPKAMEEFLRVLKPDGFAVLTCPDLRSICARIAEDKLLDTLYQSGMGPITPLDVMFGHRGSIERVTAKVFLLSPPNVKVSAEEKVAAAEASFFNQS